MKIILSIICVLFSFGLHAQMGTDNLSDKREMAYRTLFFTMNKSEANIAMNKLSEKDKNIDFGDLFIFEMYEPMIHDDYGLYEIPFASQTASKATVIKCIKRIEETLNEMGYSRYFIEDYNQPDFYSGLNPDMGKFAIKFTLDKENNAQKGVSLLVYGGQLPQTYKMFFVIESIILKTYLMFDGEDQNQEKLKKALGF